MKTKLLGSAVLCALLTTACAHRSSTDDPSEWAGRTTLNAVLEAPLGTKSNKPGDRVSATSVETFRTADGVLIPRHSKLVGSVTYVRAANTGEYQSILGLAFDHAVLENGHEIPLSATVRAIAVARQPQVAPASSDEAVSKPPRADSAAGAMGFGGARRVIVNNAKPARPSAKTLSRAMVKSPGAVGGLDTQGLLQAESRGVFGLPDVHLNERAEAGAKMSLVSAILRDVQLESGTRILLAVENTPPPVTVAPSRAMY